MSGPKHLWSGDWEREADESARAPFGYQPPAPATASAEVAGADGGGARMPRRTRVLVALGAVTTLAVAALVVVLVLPGRAAPARTARRNAAHVSTSRGTANPPAPTVTPTTPARVLAGPSADWLGLQIVTGPSGAVVNTVGLGSVADAAGFEPGDQIEQIDGYPITSVAAIRRVAARISLGHTVLVSVLRSTVTVQLSLPMVARPTFHS